VRHAVLRRAVEEWQDRLHPLVEFAPAAIPRPQVWDNISRQVGLTQTSGAGWLQRLRDSLGFWRGLSLASTTLAAVLVAVLLTRQFSVEAPPSFVAMLADDKSQPVAVVTGNARTHSLTVKLVAPQSVAADRSLELWAVPKVGNPRSLGLLAADGSITLALPANAPPDTVPLLAVTLGAILIVPAFLSIYHFWQRLAAAQKLTGQEETSVGLGFLVTLFVSPIGYFLYQDNLNKVLQAQLGAGTTPPAS